QLPPMIQNLQRTLDCLDAAPAPQALLSDAGYWTPVSLQRAVELLQQFPCDQRPELICAVPPRYQQLGDAPKEDQPLPPDADLLQRIEHRQRCPDGRRIYSKRAVSVEPVFGQIKMARNCRGFLMRGIRKVKAEWDLICLTHN